MFRIGIAVALASMAAVVVAPGSSEGGLNLSERVAKAAKLAKAADKRARTAQEGAEAAYLIAVEAAKLAGTPGAQGAQGAQGERGPAGTDGTNGQDGAQGPQGPKGDKGDTGDDGPQGLQGPAGNPVAYGQVKPNGSGGITGTTQGATVTTAGGSVYCINPGTPVTALVASPDTYGAGTSVFPPGSGASACNAVQWVVFTTLFNGGDASAVGFTFVGH